MKAITTTLTAIACLMALQANASELTIQDDDFGCMLDMQPVRGFYVDNLIEGELDKTLAVAKAGQGDYPAGSVVQLVPGEVMVKHPAGASPATRDWEFFELTATAEGTRIDKRGYADVVNKFGGNCLACHAKAKPEFDMICETGHGCDPIPLPRQMATLLQKTDPRCGGRYTPTPEEVEMLKALQAQLAGN